VCAVAGGHEAGPEFFEPQRGIQAGGNLSGNRFEEMKAREEGLPLPAKEAQRVSQKDYAASHHRSGHCETGLRGSSKNGLPVGSRDQRDDGTLLGLPGQGNPL